jgi:hypothetical protein
LCDDDESGEIAAARPLSDDDDDDDDVTFPEAFCATAAVTDATDAVMPNAVRAVAVDDGGSVGAHPSLIRRSCTVATLVKPRRYGTTDDSAGVACSNEPELIANAYAASLDELPIGPTRGGHAESHEIGARPIATPRFTLASRAGATALRTHVAKHGFGVAADVANRSELVELGDLLWRFLESRFGARRDDPGTWEHLSARSGNESNFLHTAGFTHSAFMWRARLLPRVRRAFAALWSPEDGDGDDGGPMLVSFDGAYLARPPPFAPARQIALHVDQRAVHQPSHGRVTFQAILLLTDAHPGTGGLVVVPGSHTDHQWLCERFDTGTAHGHLMPVPTGTLEPVWMPLARAGDLIVWDSRTVHGVSAPLFAMTPPARVSGEPDGGLLRIAAYISMRPPPPRVDEQLLQARRDAHGRGLGTAHWPHLHFPLYGTSRPEGALLLGVDAPVVPFAGGDVEGITDPELRAMRRLIDGV